MATCAVILLVSLAYGAMNLVAHRTGEAPMGTGSLMDRERYPFGFKMMMAVNWVIFATGFFGSLACLFQRFR